MTAAEMSVKLDEVLAKATELKDEQGSIKTLVEGLKTAVTDLQTTVAALQAQIDAGQAVDLAPLSEKVDAIALSISDSDAIADSVLANTPSEPPAE